MKSSSTKSILQFFVACVLLCCSHILLAQTWTQMPSLPGVLSPSPAMDISVGKTGAIWASSVLGTYRWNGSNWELNGKPSIRIAVDPQGAPWMINPAGQIFQYNLATKNWELKPGTAKDIAIGADGSVRIIGTNVVPGGYDIYKWNGSDWTKMPGGALRVAVDPSGSAWVVNSFNEVFHYEGNDFVVKPGAAKDIGVGADGSLWSTAPDDKVYKRIGNTWQQQTGSAVQIAVGPDGNAWTVNSAGQIFHTNFIRIIFPRNATYESSILRALRDPEAPYDLTSPASYAALDPLHQIMGKLALSAAEVYFANNSTITAEEAIGRVSSFDDLTAKRGVRGILTVLVMNEVTKNSSDPQTIALKSWATNIFRSIRVRCANAVLKEYQKWKVDPCSYKADGYTAPPDCGLKGLNFTEWFSKHSAPQDVIGKAGLKLVLANNADALASTIAVSLAAVTMAAAGATLTSILGAVAATTSAGGATALVSLCSAFGGTAGVAAGTSSAGAIGAAGWASVAAAPIAAAVLAIVVGTIEGFRVVQDAQVEPMLKMKLGAAMSEPINLTNMVADANCADIFFIAFQESARMGFVLTPPNVNGEVRFYCQAGYVSTFKLSYTVNNQYQEFSTPDLPVGQQKSFTIPYNATNIGVQGWWYDVSGKKLLFSKSMSGPTYTCYTSYGTIFNPDYKTDCPEVGNMTTNKNELTITQGGGYTAWIKLTYTQNGTTVIPIWRDGLAIGWRKVFTIPEDATNIHLEIQAATGLAWDPWKTIIDKTWPSPPNVCIKVYGTTLAPQSNAECN